MLRLCQEQTIQEKESKILMLMLMAVWVGEKDFMSECVHLWKTRCVCVIRVLSTEACRTV